MDDLEECCTVSTNHGKEWRAPWYWKWYILGLASLITFGGYYSFDFPSVTHNQLFRHFTSKYHHLSSDHFEQTAKDFEFKFNLLFSLYSMPNTFLPFVGGIAIDKIGNNKVIIVTSSLVLFGNLVQTYGCFTVNMTSFLIGRFIFGLGGEVLQVCANVIISKWFNGYELAFAMAVNLSACKLAGVLTDWLSPYFESEYGIIGASFIVSFVCLLCYLVAILLIYEEIKYHGYHSNHNDLSHIFSPDDLPPLSPTPEPEQILSTPNAFLIQSPEEIDTPYSYHSLGLSHSSSRESLPTPRENQFKEILEYKHYQQHLSSPHLEYHHTFVPPTTTDAHHGTSHKDIELIELHRNDKNTNDPLNISKNLFPRTKETEPIRMNENTPLLSLQKQRDGSHSNSLSNVTLEDLPAQTPNNNSRFDFSFDMNASTILTNLNTTLAEVQEVPKLAWSLFFLTFLMYGTFIPFSNISNSVILEVFYRKKHEVVDMKKFEIVAARLQSVPYLLTVFLTPPLGIMCDWYGHRTAQLISSTLFLLTAHFLIYTAAVGAMIPLLLIGMAYSVFGSISWPCVPIIVDDKIQGTSYGLMSAFQNSAQFIVPLILAEIFRMTGTYSSYELCFMTTSFLAVLLALWIWYHDGSQGGKLRAPATFRD